MKIEDKILRRKNRRRYELKTHNYQQLHRLSIFRSNKHIYAQIIDDKIGKTIVSCCSNNKDLKEKKIKGYNIEGAKEIGKLIAEKAKELSIFFVIWDIGQYKYHGRVKALIENARNFGLKDSKEIKRLKTTRKQNDK